LFVFGTRPEAIKLAPVIRFAENERNLDVITVTTAQHRDMLDQALEVFQIKPDYDLNIMLTDQTLSDITRNSVTKLDSVIKSEHPDVIVVQGDTTTAFVGGLVGYYNRAKVAHVEAGLRSFDKFNPFPEEVNRRLISVVADYHFAPTTWAKKNLLSEGIGQDNIFVTGNTVVDALISVASSGLLNDNRAVGELKDIIGKGKTVILLTVHRRENIGDPMVSIFKAVSKIAESRDDVIVIYPVHKNPSIRSLAAKYFSGVRNVILKEPLSYLEMIYVLKNCKFVLTDSGGLQEEAPTFNKPVLVLREVTERPEGVEHGCAKVVGTDSKNLEKEINALLDNDKIYSLMSRSINPFGDGRASGRIIDILLFNFGVNRKLPDMFNHIT
jgi:UDP-N-acetylglucosamine 2-epimerase (non-hydrolysing)